MAEVFTLALLYKIATGGPVNNSNIFTREGPGNSGEICILINSIFYFIGSVFIINNNGNFRLVARHNGKILMDKPYRTLRGAKIAFSKLFNYRGWKEDVKAEWSVFYVPDPQWLKEKSKGIKAWEE